MDELDAGLSWRAFTVRVAGFSPASLWREAFRMEAEGPIEDPSVAEREALRFFGGM